MRKYCCDTLGTHESSLHYVYNWNMCGESMKNQLSACGYKSSAIIECPIDTLNSSFQEMNDLESFFVKGFEDPYELQPGVTACGEFVTVRVENNLLKTYTHGWVMDTEQIYFGDYAKLYPGHHLPLSSFEGVEHAFNQTKLSKG